MRKIVLYWAAIILVLFLGACEREALSPESESETKPQIERKITITASVPRDDDPTTKVSLEETDAEIILKWQVGDVLNFAFVKEGTKAKNSVTLTAGDITNGGKRATFAITIPSGFSPGTFDLYGVYGGGGIDITGTNPVAKLPTNAGNATSLAGDETTSIQKRKDVMLYFASKAFDPDSPQPVTFKHLGSLFSITLKNSGSASLDNLYEARLAGINHDNNLNWAYNSRAGGKSFNLVTGKFLETAGAGEYLSFRAKENNLPIDAKITFWGWYPPLPEEEGWSKTNIWPELKLELRDVAETLPYTSVNSKPARSTRLVAGNNYYFYAVWDGSSLNFTDESFTPPLGDDVYFVAESSSLSAMLNQTQKDSITTMIITGTLKATDFDLLKSGIPKLKYLDLKDVTCVDNKMPENALGGNNINHLLTTIILPKSIKTIGNKAFHGCSKLTSLTFPAGLETIEKEAFYGCTGFTSLTLNEGLETIGESAFRNCSEISGTVIFPISLESIGIYGFNGCTKVTAFRFPHATLFPYSEKMLYKDTWSNVGNVAVQVSTLLVDDYKAAQGWSAHASYIVAIPAP
ncbi:MAG: leucine-rich repeat domain-containing protein [Bacteroidales bacterium]